MTEPAISVVIPVHNAAPFLDACLQSVLAQESPAFEVVIYNDGSTDGSGERATAWAKRDDRIRVEHGAERSGAVRSSNRVVELARAPLIARIDADDVMLRGRLRAQHDCLIAHHEAVMVAGLAWTIDAAGRRVRAPDWARLLRSSPFAPFAHSATMFRRSAWERVGGYRVGAEKWEDVDFFRRVAEIGEIRVLPRAVIEYRQHQATTRFVDGLDRIEEALDAMVGETSATGHRSHRIAPAVYRHIGATQLWSGGRPRLFGRIVRRAGLRADRETAALLGWAAMAQLAPGLLRSLLRLRLAHANRDAIDRLGNASSIRWRPNERYVPEDSNEPRMVSRRASSRNSASPVAGKTG